MLIKKITKVMYYLYIDCVYYTMLYLIYTYASIVRISIYRYSYTYINTTANSNKPWNFILAY